MSCDNCQRIGRSSSILGLLCLLLGIGIGVIFMLPDPASKPKFAFAPGDHVAHKQSKRTGIVTEIRHEYSGEHGASSDRATVSWDMPDNKSLPVNIQHGDGNSSRVYFSGEVIAAVLLEKVLEPECELP